MRYKLAKPCGCVRVFDCGEYRDIGDALCSFLREGWRVADTDGEDFEVITCADHLESGAPSMTNKGRRP